jgi:MFS family permease
MVARPGLPAAILSRGLLTFMFFGADAYLPLAIQDVRHRSPAMTGVAVTASALAWTAGSWIQAHLSSSRQARQFVFVGTAAVLAGIAGLALALNGATPLAVAVVAWGVGGFGMGLAYAPITLYVLRHAPPGQEGSMSASLSLLDTLGWAVGAGLGGAALAAVDAADGTLRLGVGLAYAISATAGVVLLFVSRRLATSEVLARD